MSFAQKIDFNTMMEPVAIRLLGEPAQKHGQEWRYGYRGSLAVDIKKGTWFDHEANIGGGGGAARSSEHKGCADGCQEEAEIRTEG